MLKWHDRDSTKERRATRLGAAAALLVLGTLVGTGFVFDSQPTEERTSARPIADLDEEPLTGGHLTSLGEATQSFPVPLFRPSYSVASDSTVYETWIRLGASPEVWIQYKSGLVVLVRPIGALLPTREYAAAQIAQGIQGRIVTIGGIEAFLVPQTAEGSGSVRLILDGVLVDILGYIGDFSVDDLMEAANSVVETADEIAAPTSA